MHNWKKKKVMEKNSNDWSEEVESVNSLRWYRMAKDDGIDMQRGICEDNASADCAMMTDVVAVEK